MREVTPDPVTTEMIALRTNATGSRESVFLYRDPFRGAVLRTELYDGLSC